MTWFKVDDKLHGHVKARRAGVPAIGLWALCGSYCADNLTDGFVAADVPALFAGRDGDKLAQRLVEAKLWHVVEGGWYFHDWEDFQPAAESVRAKREAAKQRMTKARSQYVRANKPRTNNEQPGNSARSSPNPVPVPVPKEELPPTPFVPDEPAPDAAAEPVAAAAAGDSDLDEPEVRCGTVEPGERRSGTSISELRQRMRERAGDGLDCRLTLVQEIGFVKFVQRAPSEGFCDEDFLALADMAASGEFAKVYENKRELSAMLGWPTSAGMYPAAGLLAALKIAKAWRLKPRPAAQKLTVVPKPAPKGPRLTHAEMLAEYERAKAKLNAR